MKLFHSLYFLTRIPKECMKLHCASRGAISRTTGVLLLERFCNELLHFTLHVLHAFLQDEANHPCLLISVVFCACKLPHAFIYCTHRCQYNRKSNFSAVLARTYCHSHTQPTLAFMGFFLGVSFHAVFPACDHFKLYHIVDALM
jgi:hypothetical protein